MAPCMYAAAAVLLTVLLSSKKQQKIQKRKETHFYYSCSLFPSHYDFTIILIQMYFSRKTFLKAKHVYWNTFEINNFNQLIFK